MQRLGHDKRQIIRRKTRSDQPSLTFRQTLRHRLTRRNRPRHILHGLIENRRRGAFSGVQETIAR